jgi:hypothetical protein
MNDPSDIQSDVAKLSEKIISLIFEREYDQASVLIDSARQRYPPTHIHRLDALAAVLQRETGNLEQSIRLMQKASAAEPKWLSHLYRLAVFLMESARWLDANVILDELIAISERRDNRFFIDEARFRKIICLKALGRRDEIKEQREKIEPRSKVFIGDRSCGLDDL